VSGTVGAKRARIGEETMKMIHLGTIAVSIGFLLLLASAVAAQTPGPTTTLPREGPWALLFQVKGDFVLASLQGSKVSIQHDVRRTDAIRLGASVTASSSEATAGERDSDESSVDVSAIYVYYPSRGQEVSPFFGIGPAMGLSDRSSSQFLTLPTDSVDNYLDSRSDGDSWQIGGQALLGAEWLVTRHIALTGEYALSAWYTREHSESEERRRVGDGAWATTYSRDTTNSGWSFGEMAVKLGVIIYF
jgi:opacity protein-like surface antigen